MTGQAKIYRDHADRALAAADVATLENVRDRNLRAANAWLQMADRQEQIDKARMIRDQRVIDLRQG